MHREHSPAALEVPRRRLGRTHHVHLVQVGIERRPHVREGVKAAGDDLVALAAALRVLQALLPDLWLGQARGEGHGDEDAAPAEGLHAPGLYLLDVVGHRADHDLPFGPVGGGEVLDERGEGWEEGVVVDERHPLGVGMTVLVESFDKGEVGEGVPDLRGLYGYVHAELAHMGLRCSGVAVVVWG